MPAKIPITDNHMHIDPRARGLEAVKEFQRSGGTHIILVAKPSWSLGIAVRKPEDYLAVFDETVEIASKIREIGVGAFPVLGVHPAEISKLTEYMELSEATETMKKGLEIAAGYVEKGLAVGIKSGRPHYPVPPEIWAASNEIMEHAFSLGKEQDCAVQLHTESVGKPELEDIAERAKKTGIKMYRVVKHYSPPLVNTCEELGIFPGVISVKGAIEQALEEGTRFMMETDYIDDPDRPGAVLGPKTIPKRTLKLIETHGEEPFWTIHKENPEKVYDIEIEL
ncbi:metal-dependent hydrolase [Methanosarcina sp. 2.H.T.1A.6]|uniref:TatD family hydrolase n=1 Tax=unclassified Methanosarcina TaxID=2644672 RepID=UPI000621E4C4|nr:MULTISPECIES: TatD family hydrolase [unclassified Methanosarcina]KKG18091.1 metal-dependent hydrolase [Methanosarcina sp. 2.H.T.1A.3]KKG20040.1 metal-dependent hydrolase [Methanosarcina sp. 2.H.T.1A.6]KKG22704.1 metal-dependent hydrolase [Methanosarcina sp. 2.H.T.1A.8]KKG25515.1 metal-dependent hydrolase [Methanosarcina sp. 2.H.T.1A.15]